MGEAAHTARTNSRIGKTGKLLGHVKQYRFSADYSKSPDCPRCYGSPSKTAGDRHLYRTIRRAYQEFTPEIRAFRRGTGRAERDSGTIHIQLGIGQVFSHCGAIAEIGERVGTQKHLAGFAERIIFFASGNRPLDIIRVFYKTPLVLFAYGRAFLFFTKGGVLMSLPLFSGEFLMGIRAPPVRLLSLSAP